MTLKDPIQQRQNELQIPSSKTLVCHPYEIFQWFVTKVQPRTWLWTKPKTTGAWVCGFLRDLILPYVYQRYNNCLCSTQPAMDFAAAVNSTHSSRAQDNWSAPSAAGPLLPTVILVSVTYWRRAWTCSWWKINGRIPVGRSGGSPNPFSAEPLSTWWHLTGWHPSPFCPQILWRKQMDTKLCCDHAAFANLSHKALWSSNHCWGKGQAK